MATSSLASLLCEAGPLSRMVKGAWKFLSNLVSILKLLNKVKLLLFLKFVIDERNSDKSVCHIRKGEA